MKKLLWALLLAVAIVAGPAVADSDEPLSTGRYITGGILGSAIGLGIGHAVQRRYLPLGLIFSLGEAAGWTAFFADSTLTTTSSGFTTRVSSIGTVGVIGLVTTLGLHVWEIVDVWVTGNQLRKKEAPAKHASRPFTLVPVVMHQEAPGATLVLNF